jgi:hypothetical protein
MLPGRSVRAAGKAERDSGMGTDARASKPRGSDSTLCHKGGNHFPWCPLQRGECSNQASVKVDPRPTRFTHLQSSAVTFSKQLNGHPESSFFSNPWGFATAVVIRERPKPGPTFAGPGFVLSVSWGSST